MRNSVPQICRWVFLLIATAMLSGVAHATEDRNELQSEFLMDFVIDTTEPQQVGSRRVVPITGGYFEGPGLKGTVLNVGADWIKARPDGTSELDVRVTLETEDGALIYMSYAGILSRTDESLYWRVLPRFETASEKYAYLNNLLAVGIGKRVDGKTGYSIYRIL
ncbi:DUF3237 domain-containing protein [Gilvimarinus sp. F26214L]|uniref:DUF3237 domain-containing protein n=1 Tax=Gilvimarinus sp. DZF01 TaxID=3461371 RepID=UPI0040457226